jgi:leukotriene-A4 hydrolase
MVDAAERIAGPYPFKRYDVLLMPPTYIVGGMEHPMLNFVNPFSVVGDNHPENPEPKSLIAHELAHSWAGDSATLATWGDVWVNEGITSYLTHRILEEMSGPERGEYGWFTDRRSYTAYAAGSGNTILHHAVPKDPFTGFGSTGYVKGALFMRMLEDHIGRETFDRFLRRYFQVFAFRWVDDQNFLALLREVAIDGDAALEATLRLDEWLYQPGLPSNLLSGTASALYSRAEQRAQLFASGVAMSALAPQTWTTLEADVFVSLVSPPVLGSRMAEVDAALQLSARGTPPLAWMFRSTESSYEPGMLAAERILRRGGPNGWIIPLYNALVQNGHTDRAMTVFNEARKRYAVNVEANIAALLGLGNATASSKRAA